ncbi:MAG: 50S ribosomal protein L31 [Rickettsiales bacterium]
MAKAGIHPEYHDITVVMTDGTKFTTRSTYGKAGDVLQLDTDPKTHPAWVGGVHLKKTGRLESFSNRFAGIASINKAPGSDASQAAKKDDETAA